MDITFKHKKRVIGFFDLQINSRIRLSFDTAISDDEKKEIISSILETRNVPEKYEDIHNFIKNIYFPKGTLKDLTFGTYMKNNSCYIDIVMSFMTVKNFEDFLKGNANLSTYEL